MMSADSLASRIEENLTSCGFEMIDQNKCLVESIAKAIVDEIQQNAEVTGTDSEGGECTGEVK
jgi:hypothetical protein